MITRGTFLRMTAASLAIRPFAHADAGGSKFYFAIIADTHIIDPYYKGPESNAEDTESMFRTEERLVAARTLINSLQPKMEKVFLVGDYFHNYPSPDIDFYFQHETRLDKAKALTDAFAMPVHPGFGNHDYDAHLPREMSHELFRRKFGLDPYYSVEHRGWKFVHLNNFLGNTWKRGDPNFNTATGSLGEEQLNWFEAELRQHKPTFVFIHYPLTIVKEKEVRDYGVQTLIKRYRDTIQRVISGHWHKWFEFGRSFGPPHLVIAATRYDPNAYLIVEADLKNVSHDLLNIDLVDWNTHYSQPYKPGRG
ncbi:MAG TPA: hypothetical protein VMB03_11590 [Bryobacteraceae bacterium]|nr:hypothetical protein [Bryobacteraceae bacterium]